MRSAAAGILLAAVLAAGAVPAQNPSTNGVRSVDTAIAQIRQENYPGAVETLAAVLAADPSDLMAMVYLGYLYSIRGDDAKAKEILTRALSRDDRNIAAMLLLADLSYKEQDLDLARELYQRIDALRPDIQAVNIRLYELTKFEDRELSHRYYLKALQLDRTDLREFLGLQGSRARDLSSGLDAETAERTPVRPGADRTNDIVQLFLYDQSPSTNIDEAVSNTVVLAQTKVRGGGRGLRVFRSFGSEQAIGRTIGSLFALTLFWIAGRFRRTGRRGRFEESVVFSNYRKKF